MCTNSKSSDASGNITVTLNCHEERDPPSIVDMIRAFFSTGDPEAKRAIGTAVFRDLVTGRGNAGNLNDLLPNVATDTVTPLPPTIPLNVLKVLDAIDVSSSAGPNIEGKNFNNDGRGGGQVLPPTDGHGNAVTYREWDVKPSEGGRGAERLVTGSDGSAYYTSDHYHTFEKVR